MAVKIRLTRGGAKKSPHYSIVVANPKVCRDGKFIERVGHYHPLFKDDNAQRIVVEKERIDYWLSVGAQPTDRVKKLLIKMNIIAPEPYRNRPVKSQPKAKAQERMKAAEAAKNN